MKLINGDIRPGIVKSVLPNGSVKAISPGLFVTEDGNISNLPPIMPSFFRSPFSFPSVGDDIWILSFNDNPLQLFWIKKNDLVLSDLLSKGSAEILCNRITRNGIASLYFTDTTGWVMDTTDAKLALESDGSILLSSNINNRAIHINDENISIGSKDTSAHPAAFGDKTEDTLNLISSLFSSIAVTALSNPYTAKIGTEILNAIGEINDSITEISSENVTID